MSVLKKIFGFIVALLWSIVVIGAVFVLWLIFAPAAWCMDRYDDWRCR